MAAIEASPVGGDGGARDVDDPDTQAAHTTSWMPGGRQTWPASLARAALAAAKERDALAIVVGAEREGAIAPATAFLLASGALALLAICSWPAPFWRTPPRYPRTPLTASE